MKKVPFAVSRENHLDHMVKVVPLIVMGYAIQCYFILNAGHTEFATNCLLGLAVGLGLMIVSFITYDLKHHVHFSTETLEIRFYAWSKTIAYQDITQIAISHEGQSFTTMTLTIKNGSKHRFFFIDDGEKIKSWLLEQQTPYAQAA
jgi:hypothetical protein